MDRRRFVPSPESLEGRTLQANVNTLFGLQVNANLNVPITYQQKSLRIERLPFYLDQIAPHGRFLPKAEMQQIKDSLFNMVDAIHRPLPQALNNYNYQLRKVVNNQSLTADDIDRLGYSFRAVLHSAKTPADSVTGMNTALFNLTSQVDTASVLPVTLATNDYTLVLETALAIGRPMPPPTLPKIKKNQGIQADSQHIKTPLERPILVGTYHYHTQIQVVTPDGVVVGVEQRAQEQQLQGPDHDAPERGRPSIPAPGARLRRPYQPPEQEVPHQGRPEAPSSLNCGSHPSLSQPLPLIPPTRHRRGAPIVTGSGSATPTFSTS